MDQFLTFCIQCQIVLKGSVFDDALDLLMESCSYLCLKSRNKQSAECSRTLLVIHSGEVRRPAFNVPRENINLYFSWGFLLEKMAEMFCTGRKTNSEWIRLFHMRWGYQNYSDISDDCLDDFVKRTLQNFPNCGIRRVIAFLLGIHFTWERVLPSISVSYR